MRFGAVPGSVLGAEESGGSVGVHAKTGRTLETDGVVVGEVTARPHAVGRHSRVTAVDYCRGRDKRGEKVSTVEKWDLEKAME